MIIFSSLGDDAKLVNYIENQVETTGEFSVKNEIIRSGINKIQVQLEPSVSFPANAGRLETLRRWRLVVRAIAVSGWRQFFIAQPVLILRGIPTFILL